MVTIRTENSYYGTTVRAFKTMKSAKKAFSALYERSLDSDPSQVGHETVQLISQNGDVVDYFIN